MRPCIAAVVYLHSCAGVCWRAEFVCRRRRVDLPPAVGKGCVSPPPCIPPQALPPPLRSALHEPAGVHTPRPQLGRPFRPSGALPPASVALLDHAGRRGPPAPLRSPNRRGTVAKVLEIPIERAPAAAAAGTETVTARVTNTNPDPDPHRNKDRRKSSATRPPNPHATAETTDHLPRAPTPARHLTTPAPPQQARPPARHPTTHAPLRQAQYAGTHARPNARHAQRRPRPATRKGPAFSFGRRGFSRFRPFSDSGHVRNGCRLLNRMWAGRRQEHPGNCSDRLRLASVFAAIPPKRHRTEYRAQCRYAGQRAKRGGARRPPLSALSPPTSKSKETSRSKAGRTKEARPPRSAPPTAGGLSRASRTKESDAQNFQNAPAAGTKPSPHA